MTIAEQLRANGEQGLFDAEFDKYKDEIVERIMTDKKCVFMFLPWGQPIESASHIDGSRWFNVNETYRYELEKRLKNEGLKVVWGSYKVRTTITAFL